jgi:hypothetical protein
MRIDRLSTGCRALTRAALFLLLACGCATGNVTASAASSPPQIRPDPSTTTTEAEVVSGEATLHLWSRGGTKQSPVLVLINGGPGLSHASLVPLQEALATPP